MLVNLQTWDVGGFVPAAAEGDLTKESTRKTAEAQIDTELERLRPMTNLVTDDASLAPIQKEIDRLVNAKAKLADIEEDATKAREAQFEADKRAAKEQAIANIKAHEAQLRQNQLGGGMGDAFTRPGGELGAVAPVARGMASGTTTTEQIKQEVKKQTGPSQQQPPSDLQERVNQAAGGADWSPMEGKKLPSSAELQKRRDKMEKEGASEMEMQDAGLSNVSIAETKRDEEYYAKMRASAPAPGIQGPSKRKIDEAKRQQYQKTGNVRKDVQALGVQKMDSMLASVADPTAQATPQQRAEIEKHKAATATRTPQAQDMIERGEAQRELDSIKKKRGDYQTYMGQQSDDENTRTAANWKRQADLSKRHGGGEALTPAELTELKVLNEGAGLTGVAAMAEKDREGGMQSVNVKEEGLRTFATGKFVGEEAEADKRDAERQKVLEERLKQPKVKTPRLDDSITRDMAALREEQARQGVGDGPIDVTKQIGFNKYNDPKDIAAKQREEGIAKYKASIPRDKFATATSFQGDSGTAYMANPEDDPFNRGKVTGPGDYSLLADKPGMMAGSQQTLAFSTGY